MLPGTDNSWKVKCISLVSMHGCTLTDMETPPPLYTDLKDHPASSSMLLLCECQIPWQVSSHVFGNMDFTSPYHPFGELSCLLSKHPGLSLDIEQTLGSKCPHLSIGRTRLNSGDCCGLNEYLGLAVCTEELLPNSNAL